MPQVGNHPGFKSGTSSDTNLANLQPNESAYPISSTLNPSSTGTVQWTQTRPSLTGGIAGGRVTGMQTSRYPVLRAFLFTFVELTGTAPATGRPEDSGLLSLDDGASSLARRKNSVADQSMRRTIQDLVTSVDPNVKIEPEVEDVSTKHHNSVLMLTVFLASTEYSR
jgi:transcription initiation factor TFIID subunit 12